MAPAGSCRHSRCWWELRQRGVVTDGSWSSGLRARQGRGRLASLDVCLCLPGSEATQAWLRQEASLLPSHRESRSTMFLCAMALAVFWGPKICFGVIVFLPDWRRSPRERVAYKELVWSGLCSMGLAGLAGNPGSPSPLLQQPVLSSLVPHG